MVTKNEQMAPIVQPTTAILIAVAFVVIGIIAYFMASAPKPAASTTSTYTQDSGNQPGTANNSMSPGGTSQEVSGSPGQNSVLPSK